VLNPYLGLEGACEILPIMVQARQTIALAGVGDLGRYVCEGLIESSEFDIVVLTREVSELHNQSVRMYKLLSR